MRRKGGTIRAHLDFTLVWQKPIQAVRILEIKSTERIPDVPREQHTLQTQGQVDLLRHCWNKPVFTYRNDDGIAIHENLTFPKICWELLNLDISSKPRLVSVESWLLYLSMKEARAFGPYLHDPVSLARLTELADKFHADLKQSVGDPPHLNDLAYAQGFYALCNWCEFNADCPKYRQGQYQPQWEPAIRKLNDLKKQQENVKHEITEIENALKQAHSLSASKDWIDTGEHRFRMSTVAGRKSLNQDALKGELCEIFDFLHEDIDVDAIFKRCTKQGASFPRLTIAPVN